MAATAVYLYCIVKSSTAPSMARVPAGLGGATRPKLVRVGSTLRLVVSDVPLAAYGTEPLERSMRDMRWVGEAALAHEAVVEYFTQRRGVTVVPMKLFTMFSSPDRAVESVKARSRAVSAVFRRVQGCGEWGVRVTRAAPAEGKSRKLVRATSGAAFLTAKVRARDDAREALRLAADAAQDTFEELRSIARAARRRDVEPDGAATPPLLDAAFLVPATALRRFKAAAHRLAAACARSGAAMTLTGPWPPYNFVQLEDSL